MENNGMDVINLTVGEEDEGIRLDLWLASELSLSRSRARALLDRGLVSSDSGKVKPSRVVKAEEIYSVLTPEPVPMDIVPEYVPFEVVYEDRHILVIDKPAGVVVHPGTGNWSGTLVHGLLHRYPDIGTIGDVMRPGIVHRLDAATSGLMVVARDDEAMRGLQEAFQGRRVFKEYLALGVGKRPLDEGVIDAPIGRDPRNRLKMAVVSDGRESVTGYRVLWSRGKRHLICCKLYTGRTHQIRVHLKSVGCPIDGDVLYGTHDPVQHILQDRIFLHSWKLGFVHPVTGERLAFRSVLPLELREALGRTVV